MADDPLIESLERAVEQAPGDVPLRLHLARLLLDRGRANDAITHLAVALQHEPTSAEARALMARAVNPVEAAGPAPSAPDGFNWKAAEAEMSDIASPMLASSSGTEQTDVFSPAYDVDETTVRLADVGGMADVKARLDAAFLAPMRNPELRRVYGKQLRGGLLLYGPPGCGKTFLARAVAGELESRFLAVSLADVLDMYVGQSERNLHDMFELARRSAPCVLFLDEVDAIGQKRSHLRHAASMRSTVNQLLHELDGVATHNEGLFVLAATNQPWDVDPALRRPGRLDRTVLVTPPDAEAREAILRYHLRDKPTAGVDVGSLARATDGFSGADLAHICDGGAERALVESARTGEVRFIGHADLEGARAEIRPSVGPWYEMARNVVTFANVSGDYDDLLTHLRQRKLL